MNVLIWALSILNIYLGLRCFLNVIHVLQDSKYSRGATTIFAVLFLAMGSIGLYLSLVKNDFKLALLIEIGPWIFGLVFLLFNMLTNDYK